MSRARDIASSGVTSAVLSAKAPLASPDFTGTVDLTGTTLNLDNDQINGSNFWWDLGWWRYFRGYTYWYTTKVYPVNGIITLRF